jgi:hypothetical protein
MINIEDLKKDIERAIEEVIKEYDYDYADLFGEEVDIYTNDKIITINFEITEEDRNTEENVYDGVI